MRQIKKNFNPANMILDGNWVTNVVLCQYHIAIFFQVLQFDIADLKKKNFS